MSDQPPNGSSGLVRSIELLGPAGRIEALLNTGKEDAQYAAVVSHPHPLFGGTMHNKVVYHAMKSFQVVRHPRAALQLSRRRLERGQA